MPRTLLSVLIILSVSMVYAQKPSKKLPTDLNVEKIIFLKYDMLPEDDPSINKMGQRMYKKRNKSAVEANKQLEEAAREYPYQYVIASRNDIDSLKEEGYKYVYECSMMKKYNDGVNMYAGQNKRYVSDMLVINLQTGEEHKVFEVSQTFVYYYKGIIKKLLKKVKKEFK